MVPLKLSKGRIHVFIKLLELFLATSLKISLAVAEGNDTFLRRLGEPPVAEHAAFSDPSSPDSCGEEGEGKDDIEPDVGEDGPGGGDKEHTQMLDLPDFIVGDDIHAQTNDHEQVEGSGSDNCSGSKISSLKALGPDLNDGQHDLGSGRSECHEGQVSHSLVPDLDNDNLRLASLGVDNGKFLLLGGDHLNGLHELVRDNGDTDEEVEHEDGIEKTTSKPVSGAETSLGDSPQGNDQTIVAVDSS